MFVIVVCDSFSELVLVDVLCELVEVVLVGGPCELDVDRICPPVVFPPQAPDWRGSTGIGGRVFDEVPGSL